MKRIITSLIIGCCLLGLLPVSLQAQKKGKDIMKEKVNFKNGIWKMAGDLYLPEGFNKNMKYAAVICVHPGGGVKEQTAVRLMRPTKAKARVNRAVWTVHTSAWKM